MEDYLNGMEIDLWRSIDKGPYRTNILEGIGSVGQNESVTTNRLKSQENEKICMKELR